MATWAKFQAAQQQYATATTGLTVGPTQSFYLDLAVRNVAFAVSNQVLFMCTGTGVRTWLYPHDADSFRFSIATPGYTHQSDYVVGNTARKLRLYWDGAAQTLSVRAWDASGNLLAFAKYLDGTYSGTTTTPTDPFAIGGANWTFDQLSIAFNPDGYWLDVTTPPAKAGGFSEHA